MYPRVLICALTRINNNDRFNNNLLLRNLFAGWPRENLAQIYSGGDNGDEGFCGHQYRIGVQDRRLGNLFFKLKGEYYDTALTSFSAASVRIESPRSGQYAKWRKRAGRFLMESGLYELLFKLRLSKQLVDWVKEFDPDIILAQGYNLSFTWLPIWLKKIFDAKLVFYCSDDWPSYLYAAQRGVCAVTSPVMQLLVTKAAKSLLGATDMGFAFNDMMGEEYERRYGKSFVTLMHCDDPERFRRAEPIRIQPPEVKSIIATGAFDDSRWPLLIDLEEACQRLNDLGIPVRTNVLATRISEEGYTHVKACRFIALRDDPGHELMPSYLKGADLLYLPETFDETVAQAYRYSISTKAHLFMFSQQPILVYGHPICGLVKYAKREGWGCVVDKRDTSLLQNSLLSLLLDETKREEQVRVANRVVMSNNDCARVREHFRAQIRVLFRAESEKQ